MWGHSDVKLSYIVSYTDSISATHRFGSQAVMLEQADYLTVDTLKMCILIQKGLSTSSSYLLLMATCYFCSLPVEVILWSLLAYLTVLKFAIIAMQCNTVDRLKSSSNANAESDYRTTSHWLTIANLPIVPVWSFAHQKSLKSIWIRCWASKL